MSRASPLGMLTLGLSKVPPRTADLSVDNHRNGKQIAMLGLLIVLALLAALFCATRYFSSEVSRQASDQLRWTEQDDRELARFLAEAQ
jgi:hypothetical protein